MNIQIYTLGFGRKVLSWRRTTCVPPPRALSRSAEAAVFAGGFLHWVSAVVPEQCRSEEEALDKHKIVAFHLSKEEFRLISLPRSLCARLFLSYQLVDLRGVFGLVDKPRKGMGMDIWPMKDHDKEEWVKTCSIGSIFYPDPDPSYTSIHKSVIGPWENGKLLLRYGPSLISFDPNNNQWRCIYTLGLKDDKQSENNDKLLVRVTPSKCYFYHPSTEKWTKTQIPPGVSNDGDPISRIYAESLHLLSPFSKRSPFRMSD